MDLYFLLEERTPPHSQEGQGYRQLSQLNSGQPKMVARVCKQGQNVGNKGKSQDRRQQVAKAHMSENRPEWMSWGRDSLYPRRPEVSGTVVLWLPRAELPVESGSVRSGQQKAAGLMLSISEEGRPEVGAESAACDGHGGT